MKIIIPTMGRANIQRTAKNLLRADVPKLYKCYMIVPINESVQYNSVYGKDFKIITTNLYGINNIRQYIIESCHTEDNKILMMDDDLHFNYRPSINNVTLPVATNNQILEMIQWIENQLENFAHVGISARTQNFQLTNGMKKTNSFELQVVRPYRIYGFRKDIILGEKLDFHAGLKINTMDDFHMTLNLLELGYPNIISCKWAQEQCSSNAYGGASSYRNLELLKICALNLKEKHSQVVKITEKITRKSWGGTEDNPVTRIDVIIQWKKALGLRINESKLN